MKPILEWYQDLPEPIRSQAIENYDPEFAKRVNGITPSQSGAISSGFIWAETVHGNDYWLDICNRAAMGEFDDPIEKLNSLIAKLEERQEQFEKMI